MYHLQAFQMKSSHLSPGFQNLKERVHLQNACNLNPVAMEALSYYL